MNKISQAKEVLAKSDANKALAKTDRWVGACVCFVGTLVAPLLVALWLANVGVMARAWHWMLGGF